jgi:hypothetical protein
MAKFRKGSRKPSTRRRSFKRRPTVKSLARKIRTVDRRDRPVYQIYDDVYQDYTALGGGDIELSTFQLIKYFGIPFGSSVAESQIAQGIQEGSMRGNTIKLVSLTVRGQVFIAGGDGDLTNEVRLIYFWDRSICDASGGITQPTGSTSILATFSGISDVPTVGTILSGYNPVSVGKSKRIQILKEVRMSFISGGPGMTRHFTHKLKLKGKTMSLQSSPDRGEGFFQQGVGLMLISDSTVVPHPNFYCNARLCFTT